MAKEPLIIKFQKYKNTLPEDLQAREKLEISKDDIKALNKQAMLNPDFESLYIECRKIEWADFVHKKYRLVNLKGKQYVLPRNDEFPGKEIPISRARELINRTESKSFKIQNDKIKETTIYRYWPSMIITSRDIFTGNNERIIEAELRFPEENPDFDILSWQEYAVEMLQMFRDNSDLVSKPFFYSDTNEKFFLIYKNIRGEEIKRYEFPLLNNYKHMIKKLSSEYELTKLKHNQEKQDEHQEALFGFYEGIMSYNKDSKSPLPAHLTNKTRHALRIAYKTLSTASGKKRRLKEDFDSSGGHLEDEKHKDEEGNIITMGELICINIDTPLDKIFIGKIQKEISENPKITTILDKQERNEPLTPTERKTLQRFRDNLKKKYKIN